MKLKHILILTGVVLLFVPYGRQSESIVQRIVTFITTQ